VVGGSSLHTHVRWYLLTQALFSPALVAPTMSAAGLPPNTQDPSNVSPTSLAARSNMRRSGLRTPTLFGDDPPVDYVTGTDRIEFGFLVRGDDWPRFNTTSKRIWAIRRCHQS
jgi:hypothetical protein